MNDVGRLPIPQSLDIPDTVTPVLSSEEVLDEQGKTRALILLDGSGRRYPIEVGLTRRDYAMIEYKGYIGIVDFDSEIDSFHGTVINTNDVITFYGSSVAELREEMRKSVEDYLEFCREQGRKPEEPFSGKLMIRTSPDLHRRVALEAARRHMSMDIYVQEILEKSVGTE